MQHLFSASHRVKALAVAALAAVLTLVGAATISAGTRADGDNWRLLVRSAAAVKGPVVLLGDIADPVEGLDYEVWRTVSQIPLWRASDKVGRPITVTRKKLYQALRHYLGDKADNLVLPSQMTIQTGGSVLTGDELRRRVVEYLTPRFEDLGGDVEMKQVNLPKHYFFKNDFDRLNVTTADDVRPGRNQIRLQCVSPDGKIMSSKSGTVFLDVWKAVPVAAKPMNRFERVTQDKVSFMKVNLAYKNDVWDGRGGPWRMTRTLGRGQPFTMAHLEPTPVIEKGEKVSLVYKGARIQLTIKAEAMGEAGMGQQVSVRNLQSKKTIMATVIGDDTVMVR